MQTELHLAGLLVVHGGAKLIVGYEAIVCSAEGIEHVAVSDAQLAQISKQAYKSTDEESNNVIQLEKPDNGKSTEGQKDRADRNRNGGVFVCRGEDKILSGVSHSLDHGVSDNEIKEKLSAEKIEPKPAAHKSNANPHNLHLRCLQFSFDKQRVLYHDVLTYSRIIVLCPCIELYGM